MRDISRIIGHMSLREKLLKAAYRYCEKAEIEFATLSTRMRNDGKFLDGIADGKSCTIDTYEDCMGWFKKNKPIKSKRSN